MCNHKLELTGWLSYCSMWTSVFQCEKCLKLVRINYGECLVLFNQFDDTGRKEFPIKEEVMFLFPGCKIDD